MAERIERLTKDFHYLEIAKTVSWRSTCINKQFGAVIVKDDRIISTGYNGSPSKCVNCCDINICRRMADPNYKRGTTNYDMNCLAIHAEQNAMLAVSREQMLGATMYLYGYDMVTKSIVKDANACAICKRLILNSGIITLIIADPETGIKSTASTNFPYRAKIIRVDDWRDRQELLTSNY